MATPGAAEPDSKPSAAPASLYLKAPKRSMFGPRAKTNIAAASKNKNNANSITSTLSFNTPTTKVNMASTPTSDNFKPDSLLNLPLVLAFICLSIAFLSCYFYIPTLILVMAGVFEGIFLYHVWLSDLLEKQYKKGYSLTWEPYTTEGFWDRLRLFFFFVIEEAE
jgi:hypothetical protein